MTALPDRTRLRQAQDMLVSGQLVHLYMNAHLPSSGDTGLEYEEVMAPGYAAQRLDFEDWKITEGQIEATEVGFLFLLAPFPPVYGYYLTERVTSRFLWGDAFVDAAGRLAPITPSTPNFELWVTPCLRFAPALLVNA
jgi:hypothetical protein